MCNLIVFDMYLVPWAATTARSVNKCNDRDVFIVYRKAHVSEVNISTLFISPV